MHKKYTHLLPYLIIAAIVVSGCLLIKYAFSIIVPFAIAFALAILAEPFVVRFESKIPRKIASPLVLGLLYSAIGSFAVISSHYAVNCFQREINKLVPLFTNSLSSLSPKTISIFAEKITPESLLAGPIGAVFLKKAARIIAELPSILGVILISVVGSFFFSLAIPSIKNSIQLHTDPRTLKIIKQIKRSTTIAIKGYIHANILLMTVTFLVLFILFAIFKFNNTLTLAVFISFVDALPVLGVGVILIPWAIFYFLNRNISKGLLLISFYIIIIIIRQILEPRIIGAKLGLSPIATLFAVWSGLNLFGFIGVLLFPAAAVIIKDLIILLSEEKYSGNYSIKRKVP